MAGPGIFFGGSGGGAPSGAAGGSLAGTYPNPTLGTTMTYVSDGTIFASTSDAADNRSIAIAGGGSNSSTRGAYLSLVGNEGSGTGAFFAVAGDTATGAGAMNFTTGSGTGEIQFTQGSTKRLSITTGNEILPADGTNIATGTSSGSKIGTSTSQKLAFWNSTPVSQQQVSGARVNGIAISDLMTKLGTIGIVNNTTTAMGGIHAIEAIGNATNETFVGSGSYGEDGTATTRAVATTRFFTAVKRKGWVSAAGAGNHCGYYTSQPQWFLGNVAGMGGFDYTCRFGVSDPATVANSRMFVGFGPTGVPTSVNPTTLLNCMGVGCDAGETVLKWIWNDGSGTASSATLGANFPSQTLSTDWYELRLSCAANSTTVTFNILRVNTGDTATQSIVTTDLPAVNTLFGYAFWRDNGATALAVGIDRSAQYIYTTN